MNKIISGKIPFFLILLLTIFFRVYGIWWDHGFHLHPDERWIIMVAERIHMPKTYDEWNLLLTPESPLNPHFFAYGSFPIYLLKGISTILSSADYGGMLLIGRLISVTFDVGTVMVVYLIAKKISTNHPIIQSSNKLENEKIHQIGLFASFFYAISVLPIQSSHFFISDIPLTFFTTFTLYLLLCFMGKKSWVLAILIGIIVGLALSTKVTSVLLFLPVGLTFLYRFFRDKSITKLLRSLVLFSVFCSLFSALTMPYALIDYSEFKQQMLEQTKMRVDPYIFPFTLQYVGTAPYWYFIKNILLYGLGIPLALLSFFGVLSAIGSVFEGIKRLRINVFKSEYIASIVILLSYFFFFLVFIGSSAVKFMRYMLPVYPLLAVFASMVGIWLIAMFFQSMRKWRVGYGEWEKKGKLYFLSTFHFPLSILLITTILWPFSFLSIYSHTHTRIAADQWIHANIPPGSTIAIEHWDDRLPLTYSERYTFQELTLYDVPDNQAKWQIINEKLNKSDFIIIASNRLYTPLMGLTDCSVPRCYPLTSKYYQDLFEGKRNFTKVAEFSSYPQLPTLHSPLSIRDDSADESFTVYDHPKIMIFKKK